MKTPVHISGNARIFEKKFFKKMAFSGLNPTAPVFYSQKTPYILMPSMPGLCMAFQFGNCHHDSHHNSDDGKGLAIHACQACLIFRHNLVDHSCKGGHPGHNHHCGTKKFGAIACSHHQVNTQVYGSQMVSVPTPTPVPVKQPIFEGYIEKLPDGVKIPHLPSFLCNCNFCADFFNEFQTEIDDYEIDFSIEKEWSEFHFPSRQRNCSSTDDYETDTEEDYEECRECRIFEAVTSTGICLECEYESYENTSNEDTSYFMST